MHKKFSRPARAVYLITLVAVALPASTLAGGFSLNEQSASAMGTANAGAAANPENATTVLFNPAGMSQLSGTNISFGAAVLDIDAEAKPRTIQASNQLGMPVSGSAGGDIADPAVLPNFYLTHEVSDTIDVGFGIHAPYGLASDYKDNFKGRYFADETELTAISFSPSIAVSNGSGLSMGAGINLIYAEGKLTKFQDNSGTKASATGPDLAPEQGYANIEGDDVGVTFRVGFLYEFNGSTQVGLTAQTGTTLELEGDAAFTGLAVLTPPGSPVVGGGAAVGIDSTEPARVPLAIPESATLGIRHEITDSVTLLVGATYAKWSRFEALNVYGTDSTKPVTGRTSGLITHIPEKWDNTWQFNLGGVWQATPKWAFKAGYAWDESPVDKYVTARIPSSDRHWLSLGTQWSDASSGWTVDAAVGTLLFTDDAKVSDQPYILTASGTQPNPADPNSGYEAEYDLSAWSAGIQVSKAF
ncbi:OmpP1/FadL family transporter [Marinobacter sp.]|uniref:OmpP1/FadL family transporter n=1 Tax=Marinobacter sp. TaxID=50741 RepID=UPI003A8E804B